MMDSHLVANLTQEMSVRTLRTQADNLRTTSKIRNVLSARKVLTANNVMELQICALIVMMDMFLDKMENVLMLLNLLWD